MSDFKDAKPLRVCIYARESSDDTNKAPPVDNQIKRGMDWIKDNGYDFVCSYVDNGFSGGDWKREGFNSCVTDAKRHFYKVLWVWSQDRIARDTEQFLWFYRNLNDCKVKIFEDTSNDFINMDSLGDRVKHQSLAQASEIFRLITSDKVKRAYQRKKALGERWGRKKKPFDLNRAIIYRANGMGWRKIGKYLGVSHTTIRRYLIGLNSNSLKSDDKQAQKP